MTTTVETLKKARDLIASNHWLQGQYRLKSVSSDEPIGYCSIGAIRQASGFYDDLDGDWQYRQKKNAVTEELASALTFGIESVGHRIISDEPAGYEVAYWNDRPGRTKEEVLAAFDAAIDRIEKESKS